MATQNIKDFNAVNSVNLLNDSFLSVQGGELVRLNGSSATISGVNQISTNNINITGSFVSSNRLFVNGTGVLLSGEATAGGGSSQTAWFSWTPASDQNLGQDTDIFPPLNNQRYNTDSSLFELTNSGSASPAARVAIKEIGYYNFGFQFYGYDLKNSNRVTIKLYRSDDSTSALNLVRWTSKSRFAASDSDGDSFESWANSYVASTGYYAFAMYSDDANPYTIIGHDASFGMPTMSFHVTKIKGI